MTDSDSTRETLPELDARLGEAWACVVGDVLVVGTGSVERRWRWTGKGLVTVGLVNLRDQREWVDLAPSDVCDWSLPASAVQHDAQVVSLAATTGTDGGFTTEHLAVTIEIVYPGSGLTMSYVIWAYPGVLGLRTQLSIKGKPEAGEFIESRVDYVPVSGRGLSRRAIGYYDDTQNRHNAADHLIREELVPESTIPWASILCLEDDQGGIAMVKESHKCVNQPGVHTGEYCIGPAGLSNTGLRFSPDQMLEDRYLSCWASWVVLYGSGDFARELAFKTFDRIRFPVDLERDMYIEANTWGSGASGRESRDKGSEAEVLKEIDSVADLGIDMLQIDDGWQVSRDATTWTPNGGIGWKPHPDVYPEGWKAVKARAEERGVKLALWAPSESISLEDMKWNYDQAGFAAWKLDFADMQSPARLDQNVAKVREFLSYTDHRVQVVWDVTEHRARYGYFWARDYGCMWLANRKPHYPPRTVPKPWLLLRESWELARYMNTNKFQLPIQNFQRVNREVSDAYKHSHTYEVALGLAGVPVFFQSTHYYEGESRGVIRELLALYKAHRAAMFASYVFPIGDEPSNASWAGFQWYHPDCNSGYLLIFRELENQESQKEIPLCFLKPGTELALADLREQTSWAATVSDRGGLSFAIDKPADILFVRYERV